MSQETYLFNGTIRENLLYAKEDATEEELIDALRCRNGNLEISVSRQDNTVTEV